MRGEEGGSREGGRKRGKEGRRWGREREREGGVRGIMERYGNVIS